MPAASRWPARSCSAIVSSTCALYSTPSWFGTVSSSVSASRRRRRGQLLGDRVGLADVAAAEARDPAVEVAELVARSPPPRAEVRAVQVGDDRQHAAADRHPRLALPARLGPGRAEERDLLGLQLVERHAGVLGEQRRAHQVHPLLGRPHARSRASRRPTRSARAGPATAAGSPAAPSGPRHRAGRRRAPRRPAIAARNTSVCARAMSASLCAVARHVAERLGAAQRGLRRAAADPELQPPAADQVGGRRVLGHVQRVLVAHVDHAPCRSRSGSCAPRSPPAAETATRAGARSGARGRTRRRGRAPLPPRPARSSAPAPRGPSASASRGPAANGRRRGSRCACARPASPAGRALDVVRLLVVAERAQRPLALLLGLAARLAGEGEALEPRDLLLARAGAPGPPAAAPRISLRIRLRSCSAKCGVEAPISWRTSSTVTARFGARRSGCSASAMRGILRRTPVDGLDLEQRVDARLHVDGDRVLVAHEPAVVVDAAHRVLVVAGLDVEQVVLQRRGERRWRR